MPQRQIIAMGGGGFSSEPANPLLDRYILQHAVPDPVVCFVPTATGDSENYIARFYAAFSKLPCRPRHLSFFAPPPDIEKHLAESDVIYVGGGNTRNMLAIWREWGADILMRRAWESGTLLCGLSAGAICWFDHGHTDSAGPLAPMTCLGFLPGSCTPHYDGEADRRPSFLSLVASGALPAGYALDDGAALHFTGTELARVITSRPAARAFRVHAGNNRAIEEQLPAHYLGENS